MIKIDLQQYLNESIKKERGEEKKEITSWHISKIGACPRGLYLERIGAKPDREFSDRELRVFAAGKHFEDWFIGCLKGREKCKTESQVRVEDKRLNISGYVDLLIETKEEKKVYEVKTKNSRAFWYMDKEGKPMRQHEYQLWTYMHLLGIEEGSIIYLEKDTLTIREFPVYLKDKKLQEEVFNELNILNWAWAEKMPPPAAKEGSWQAKFCRWHIQCLLDEKGKEASKNP